MLVIRPEQMEALRRDALNRYVGETADAIERKLRFNCPEITAVYGEALSRDITEAVRAAEGLGIDDSDQLYDWCVVRIVSRQPFYAMEQFSDILNHPFLPPFAKARHIVLAFVTIRDLHLERNSCVQP